MASLPIYFLQFFFNSVQLVIENETRGLKFHMQPMLTVNKTKGESVASALPVSSFNGRELLSRHAVRRWFGAEVNSQSRPPVLCPHIQELLQSNANFCFLCDLLGLSKAVGDKVCIFLFCLYYL